MFDALFTVSIIGAIVEVIKESNTKTVPVENWANKKLYHKDIMDGVPIEQRLKNLENGKYKLSEYNSYQKEAKKEMRTKTEFEKRYGL